MSAPVENDLERLFREYPMETLMTLGAMLQHGLERIDLARKCGAIDPSYHTNFPHNGKTLHLKLELK